MNILRNIPFKYGISLFIILQVLAYGLDIKGLKLLAFYNEGLEMQISIMAIVIPVLVEGIRYYTLNKKK